MGVHFPTKLSRRDFLKLAAVTGGGLLATACTRPANTDTLPTPGASTPDALGIAEPTVVKDSLLMVPQEIASGGDQVISNYLVALITGGRVATATSYNAVPYINNPHGGIPQNDDPTLLTGNREPGQSLEALDNQPLSGEVRLYSTGQVVLPLTEASAESLESSVTVSELRDDGTRNVHLVYKKVQLADGRPDRFSFGNQKVGDRFQHRFYF